MRLLRQHLAHRPHPRPLSKGEGWLAPRAPLAALNAIPLGMERSVENIAPPQTPSFRRNDSEIFVGTFLSECVAPRTLPISTKRFIPTE
ncbi:MAG: hypothetical protein LBB79_09960 [Prevotellaceae bacterium]|nr:hypothetical protein [Prevotellaceae bacterium]